jgi:hypothetical protein
MAKVEKLAHAGWAVQLFADCNVAKYRPREFNCPMRTFDQILMALGQPLSFGSLIVEDA